MLPVMVIQNFTFMPGLTHYITLVWNRFNVNDHI